MGNTIITTNIISFIVFQVFNLITITIIIIIDKVYTSNSTFSIVKGYEGP